jgi:RNA polymerase sigma factor (sigma-70 family)
MLSNLSILDIDHANRHQAEGIRKITSVELRMIRAFIQKRVMNPQDVDDILQSTFLEALRNEHKFLNASKPQTWLCGIALNMIRNHFRKMYREPYLESWEDHTHSELDSDDGIGHVVDGYRQLMRAVKAIGSLPSNMQQVIEVALEMDGNYQETAASLGVPIGTVRSRLSRAREQLKRQMDPFA